MLIALPAMHACTLSLIYLMECFIFPLKLYITHTHLRLYVCLFRKMRMAGCDFKAMLNHISSTYATSKWSDPGGTHHLLYNHKLLCCWSFPWYGEPFSRSYDVWTDYEDNAWLLWIEDLTGVSACQSQKWNQNNKVEDPPAKFAKGERRGRDQSKSKKPWTKYWCDNRNTYFRWCLWSS